MSEAICQTLKYLDVKYWNELQYDWIFPYLKLTRELHNTFPQQDILGWHVAITEPSGI